MSVKYADDLFSARDVACDLAWLIIFLSLFTCVSVCVDLGAAIIMVIISLCAWISPWYVRLMPGLPSRVSGFSWPIATKCVGKYCGLKKANVHFLKILLQYRKYSSDFCCQCLEYCNDCVYCCSHAIFAWEHLLWMHHVYKCIIFEAKLEKHKFCHFLTGNTYWCRKIYCLTGRLRLISIYLIFFYVKYQMYDSYKHKWACFKLYVC